MSLVPPVYDRTELDIQLQTPKAYLNVQDYRRIEANLQTLAGAFGLEIPGSDWAMSDMPTPQRIQNILDNLQAVRAAYYETPYTPATPQLPVNHFDKVNDIERIIRQLWHFWTQNTKNIQYCGEFFADEEIGVL
jgi:hypothetical protein